MARDMNRRIIEDDESLPHFTRASQNIAAAVALLRGLLGPATPEDRRAHHESRMLLERVAAQLAESSLSQQHELDASQRTPLERPDKDVLVQQAPQGDRPCTMVPMHERLGRNRDARDTLDMLSNIF